MTWLQSEPVTLASGRDSAFKVDCDHLTDDDVNAACDLLAVIVPAFGTVHGVPTGGERIARGMQRHTTPGCPLILVVDDVWTTGGSMRRFMDAHDLPTHRGAVLFARGPVPSWVTTLWMLHPGLWDR